MDKAIQNETRQVKMVFSKNLNDRLTLFGGEAMKWMDEVAYITATRYTRKRMVTHSSNKIKFLKPVKNGSIIEIIGKIKKANCVKLTIDIKIYAEEMYSDTREKVIEGEFDFVAVNKEQKLIKI